MTTHDSKHRYREWPESGLSKFEDILHALQPQIEAADFFYFIDGDVRFQEDVLLSDVAGDLVGVEHPFYVSVLEPCLPFSGCPPCTPSFTALVRLKVGQSVLGFM